MRDQGIHGGMVQEFNNVLPANKGMFSFRRMFWKFLKKLNVPFYDPCCADAAADDTFPTRYNPTSTRIEYYNGTAWVDVPTP